MGLASSDYLQLNICKQVQCLCCSPAAIGTSLVRVYVLGLPTISLDDVGDVFEDALLEGLVVGGGLQELLGEGVDSRRCGATSCATKTHGGVRGLFSRFEVASSAAS